MTRRVLRLEIPAGLEEAALVAPAVRGIAEAAGFERARASEVALCLQEAAANAVEHACERRREELVSVVLSLEEGVLRTEVRDRGRPMPEGLLDEAGRSEPEPLAERGRGLFLITRLAASVAYSSSGGENVLRMSFPIPSAE